MSLVIDLVVPITSTVTASGVLYIAREAHEARKQVEKNRERSEQNAERSRENKERSLVNRAALAGEGLVGHRQSEDETHG